MTICNCIISALTVRLKATTTVQALKNEREHWEYWAKLGKWKDGAWGLYWLLIDICKKQKDRY